jgi:general stress protein YciG
MAQQNKPGSPGTSKRGFASMDPALQREIASKGGRSVPPEERSFSKDRSLAAQAGRKGGEASHGGRRPGAATGQAATSAAPNAAATPARPESGAPLGPSADRSGSDRG